MFFRPDEISDIQRVLGRDTLAFMPELVLCIGIVGLLLLRMFSSLDRVHLGWASLGICALALLTACMQWAGVGLQSPSDFYYSGKVTSSDIYSGLLVYDQFTVFLRVFLLGFALMTVWLSLLTGVTDREDSSDFHVLLLGATLGMMLMSSTNHLLMMFIAVEMASLPSYALAGFLKQRRRSSEAALKYVVYGGGAAGIMLYGISLLAGTFGTGYLPDLARAYVASFSQGQPADPLLVLGTIFVIIGLAFKLAAVPFHFWCPDVFEGASAEVAGFLSVASKAAAVALLARLAMALTGAGVEGVKTSLVVLHYLIPMLAVLAILTATFGNLAAFFQNNLKRLLAYSTIAHAGYMMMGLCAIQLGGERDGVKAVLFYLMAYFLMNLGAFAIVAFLRNQTGSEDVTSFRGLVRRSPWMVILLAIFLLSLLGIPPLMGFAAKFEVFGAVVDAAQSYTGKDTLLASTLWAVVAFGVLNSVMSAVYYMRVLKIMIVEQRAEDLEGKEPTPIAEPAGYRAYAMLLAAGLFVGTIFMAPLEEAARNGVKPPSGQAQTAARAQR